MKIVPSAAKSFKRGRFSCSEKLEKNRLETQGETARQVKKFAIYCIERKIVAYYHGVFSLLSKAVFKLSDPYPCKRFPRPN